MLTLLAQTTSDYSQQLQDLQEASTAANAAAATAVTVWTGVMIFWLVYGLICLAFFIWWIFLLIDLSKREFPEKTTWIIIMVVLFLVGLVWLADLLYYFMVVKKSSGASTPQAPAAPAK